MEAIYFDDDGEKLFKVDMIEPGTWGIFHDEALPPVSTSYSVRELVKVIASEKGDPKADLSDAAQMVFCIELTGGKILEIENLEYDD